MEIIWGVKKNLSQEEVLNHRVKTGGSQSTLEKLRKAQRGSQGEKFQERRAH